MGMIFMCSSKTKKDCYRYKVLGLPASKKEIVSKIYKGMRLFLFDCDLKLLYGIYKAAGPGGYNLEPKAFNSAFPSQVRFTVLDDCLPLAEEKFKKVIKDNYFTKNKFNCQLTSEQVKNLCKLFKVPSKGSKSKQLGRSREAEARSFVDRDRIRRQDREEERHRASRPVVYDREAFASPVARLPLYQPLPPPLAPALPPSYAYNRTLEADVYRRDPRLEHHDRQLLDLELRRRDEIERYDPYILSRERPLYRDPPYSAGGQPEYLPPAGLPPEYRHPVDPPLEYRPLAGQPPVYDPYRPSYRY
ncbi:hypothetical protein L1049_013516 [Liquidambar formosana]|uniref:DCD domain-containing protein n=1 Tax=Liquidambar formosana TaxID=63359 RepID=A0AAP0WU54_LIQFO